MQDEFSIINDLLRFNPKQNTNLSWLGNFVDIFSSPLLTIGFNILAIYIFISGYLLYRAKTRQTRFSIKVILICGLASCLCSLIDKLFWGGSLDFLQIPNFFIFDMKDCYLAIAVVAFVIIGILHCEEITVKEYLYFCRNKFKLYRSDPILFEDFFEKLKAYAKNTSYIDSIIIVGSYARGTNKETSDLDLVIITSNKPEMITNQDFVQNFGKVYKQQVEYYGACTSIRVWYNDGKEVEFGIVEPSWISNPLDTGTYQVLSDGYKIIIDKKRFFDDLKL